MFNLNDNQIAKLKLLIRIKLWVLSFGFLFILSESLLGVRDLMDIFPGLAGAALSGILALGVRGSLKFGKSDAVFSYISFFIDSTIIVLAVYMNGNIESTWFFAPVFVTYMGAYVFGIGSGIIFGLFTSLLYTGLFALEFMRIIPHVATYGIPTLYWQDPGYFIDSLVGIYFMHFLTAVSVGSLSRLTDQRNEKIDEFSSQFEGLVQGRPKLEKDLEAAEKMLQDRIGDVARSKKISDDRDAEIVNVQQEINALEGGKTQ